MGLKRELEELPEPVRFVATGVEISLEISLCVFVNDYSGVSMFLINGLYKTITIVYFNFHCKTFVWLQAGVNESGNMTQASRTEGELECTVLKLGLFWKSKVQLMTEEVSFHK